MFCNKCGTQSVDDAAFCQKCGAKLMSDEAAKPVAGESGPITTTKPAPTEPIHVATTLNGSGAVDINILLKENMSNCPTIKTVTQAPKGTVLKGTVYKYLVLIVSGQAKLMMSLAFPFLILDAIAYGLIVMLAANIGWDFAEYGSIYFEDYALFFALCLLVGGLIKTITPFLGRKEKETVTTYVRETLETKGIATAWGTAKNSVPIARLAASIIPALAGAIILIFILVGNLGASDEPVDAAYNPPSTTISASNAGSITLNQTYTNEEEGFSISYPSTWIAMENAQLREYQDTNSFIGLFARNEQEAKESGFEARVFVDKEYYSEPLTATREDFLKVFSGYLDDVIILELEDFNWHGSSARKLVYSYTEDANPFIETRYYYTSGSDIYCVTSLSLQRYFDKYEPIFEAMMNSYTITDASTAGTVNSSQGEILYQGIPVSKLLGSVEDVISLLGNSPNSDEFKLRYDNIEFYHENGAVEGFESHSPDLFEMDGIKLNKNRAELIALLGEPGYEGGGGNGYTMSYYPPYGSVHFELGTPNDEAWRISVMAPIYGYEDDAETIDILYDGKPILNWMGARLADLRDVFGTPDVEGIVGEGGAYGFRYEDITFIKREQGDGIESISGTPSLLSIDGTALDTNRDQLVSLLGDPTYENWGDEEYYAMLGMDNSYYMTFNQGTYSISFELDDPNGKAWSFTIYYSYDGYGDDYYDEYNASSDPVTADGKEVSVGSLVYAKQNVFGVSANYVRGYVTSINNDNSVNVMWDTVLENRLWAFDECAIFSDSNSVSGYSYYSNASNEKIQLIGIKFKLPANELYSKGP